MRGRLLDQIKIEQHQRIKKKGGKNFMKYELQASDVRLNCREGIKMVSRTKKYLSGDFRKALMSNDRCIDYIFNN